MDAAPRAQELVAPQAWRQVEFISDLHLQAAQPANFEAWRRYMAATQADAVFILGDLFDAWIGDDSAAGPGFEADCAEVLRAATRQRPVFFLHGNRDFLLGTALAADTGVTLLADPVVFDFGEQRWLLTHGDALCLDDTEYLAFRSQVRAPAWQAAVLARPLAERRALARAIRGESENLKRSDRAYPDIDVPTALAWLQAADAPVMIHGHTHRPGDDALDARHSRIVLTDWDADAQPPRREALRLTREGAWQRVPCP